MWVPGWDERYNDPPVTGALVAGVIGRPYAIANGRSTVSLLEQGAEGYVYDNMPNLKPPMKHKAVVEPLAPALAEAIRLANAKASRG